MELLLRDGHFVVVEQDKTSRQDCKTRQDQRVVWLLWFLFVWYILEGKRLRERLKIQCVIQFINVVLYPIQTDDRKVHASHAHNFDKKCKIKIFNFSYPVSSVHSQNNNI